MLRLDPKTRIVLVLVSITTSMLMIALSTGIIPDAQKVEIRGRVSLCEALGAGAASAANGSDADLRDFKSILDFVVARNPQLRSAAVRREDGSLAVQTKGHHRNWPKDAIKRSTDTFVHVPIYRGRDRTRLWGRLEMCFEPVVPKEMVQAALTHPWLRLGGFVGCSCFLIYAWYLKKVLDPTRAVPKRVRTAYDFLAGGLVALDKQERILLCNRSFLEALDLPRSELIGKRLSSLPWIHPDTDESNREFPWDRVNQSKDADLGTTLQIDSQRHGLRTLMVNAAPVIGQDGSFRGVLVGFEDITALEDTRAELQKSKAAAEAANVAKTAFLANMSHEIRTPMNAILGFTDLLRRGFDSTAEERQEYVRIIHSSGHHLLELINDILDLSKVESGRMEVESIPCDPYSMVREVITVLESKARERGISLDFAVRGRIPHTIASDPVRLRQVIVNLVNNAIKFTHQGGVRVELHVVRRGNDDCLAIDVGDTGIGIPEEKFERIFQPFSQADSSTTRKYGGTGLGLSISRKLTRMMGGDLTVRSKVDQGTTFTATIRLTAEDLGNLADEETILRRADSAQGNDRRPITRLPAGRILLVDDGESNRKLIELVLRRAGAHVVSAENGAEGLRHALQEPCDVILMDMQMPVMDGYTAARKLREAGQTLPIVAMTAHAMVEDERKCRDAGCSHFMPKPVDVDKLLRLLAELLAHLPLADAIEDGAPALKCSPTPAIPRSPSGDHGPILCELPVDDLEFLEIAWDFVNRLRMQLREMATLLTTADYYALSRLAHWLKGSGGTAGFPLLTELAKELERAAKEADHDAAELALGELITVSDRIRLPPMNHAEALVAGSLSR